MEPAITGREAAEDEELLVHDWRVARLAQFGIPESQAEVYADHIDWHQVARLVQRGCPPRLSPAAGPAHRPLMSARRVLRLQP
jgi:hypothetical protein